jgi:hypothetical protein
MARQYEALCDFTYENPDGQDYEWKRGVRHTIDEQAYRQRLFIRFDHHVRAGDLKLVTDG